MFRISRKSDHLVSKWSGGKTTQLYIFPEDASIKNLDFHFRISTATIEAEESDFTLMPQTKRLLMVLEGQLLIDHIGRAQHMLEPGKVHEFNGGWPTRSKGKVTDFNLLLRNGYTGSIQLLSLKENTEVNLYPDGFTGFYIFKGKCAIDSFKEKVEAGQGDFIAMDNCDSGAIQVLTTDSIVILVQVFPAR